MTRTGDSAEAGLDWRKPKPLASSAGIRLRRETSLTRPTSLMCSSASSRRDAARHVAGDDDDLGLEVAAPGLVGERDRVARPQHLVGGALVHERIGPEALRHLGAARLPDQLDMVHIGRAVRPLIGARQRRGGLALVEAVARNGAVGEVGRRAARAAARSAPNRRARPAASARYGRRRRTRRGRGSPPPGGRRGPA